MNHRFFCELKEVGDDGTFRGIASVMGVEDLDGDVIDKGAFTKTIQENPVVPVLWQHRSEEVIGEGRLEQLGDKIIISGRLDMTDETAKKAHSKMKSRLIKGLSVGFTTIKQTWEEVSGRMIRHIGELKLWEVSIVTFAANPAAYITSVKALEPFEERIKALESQVSALMAAKNAAPAAIPPTPEPAESHSKAITSIESLSALLRA